MNYIVGDVHANSEELRKLLVKIRPTRDDTLIFLGDYIDKNVHTKDTLDTLETLQSESNCIFIKGNHDFVWDRYLNHGELQRNAFLLKYGGVEALTGLCDSPASMIGDNKIELIKDLLADYLKLIPKMRDYHLVDKYLAIHAGLKHDQIHQSPLIFTEENYFLRMDKDEINPKYLDRYRIVAGHTQFGLEPTITPTYINIDLGAGYGYYLAAFCIEDKRVYRSDGAVFDVK
ncbi:MAG: hypothetical protein A3B30_04470 [Candidatus Komeilibacteria bacterium RIFCSPLOWO2_01_FULL_52_15]|uniref:Calcineurin-like phosphoesterase domain-containing protein n=2 Tax=Candidatus Komeiliibacteriota TaxID=1817908 RepID=A0A1G2BPT3_9BACT|nr:MAG: hypothetical protein A2677_04230 [Candidatus Komeilibacteria bacterium RIFCSPHIGHO2_01_FULL_52_14]OGY91134.1 MAG: hypothetical protein A3B30_04470 [Candidatus Komeilibacteria bacterium RIFCSPLOWO2_01_FULL_52_15]